MPFTVTREFAEGLLLPVVKGDVGPFMAACTPTTTFQVGAVLTPGEGHTGSYTLASFGEKAFAAMGAAFDLSSIKRDYTAIEVAGNKIITEQIMTSTTFDGKEYYQRFAEFYVITDEGKIGQVRVYMDTELQAVVHKAVEEAKAA